jgi:hypothetical protein
MGDVPFAVLVEPLYRGAKPAEPVVRAVVPRQFSKELYYKRGLFVEIIGRVVDVRNREFHRAAWIGVQRPATALTGPDPADTVCRRAAKQVN